MNPCIDCSFDRQGCHESGLADAKCQLWYRWKMELHNWRPDKFKKPRKGDSKGEHQECLVS